VTGTGRQVRVQPAWRRSLRDEGRPRRPRSVLDAVMVPSVALALVCLAAWFFLFAGSSLPT
jgi:hypothetical protein